MWKSKDARFQPLTSEDVVTSGKGEKVSLLKDWRERFQTGPLEDSEVQKSPSDEKSEPHNLAQPSEVEDGGRRETSNDDRELPSSSSLTNKNNNLQTQTEDSELAVHNNHMPSKHAMPAPAPAHNSPPRTAQKRKAAQIDQTHHESPPSKKPTNGKSTSSTATAAKSPKERSNGFIHKQHQQHQGESRAQNDLDDGNPIREGLCNSDDDVDLSTEPEPEPEPEPVLRSRRTKRMAEGKNREQR